MRIAARRIEPKEFRATNTAEYVSKLIGENITRLCPGIEEDSPGVDMDDPNLLQPSAPPEGLLGSPALRQKLTIHESKLKKLFHKWSALVDDKKPEAGQPADESARDKFTLSYDAWRAMFETSGIMDDNLTGDQLLGVFVHAMLGDFEGVVDKWANAREKNNAAIGSGSYIQALDKIIFPEFVESITRVAIVKFAHDHVTPIDLKVHEVCLLLINGPAGAADTGRNLPASRMGGGR